VGGVWDEAPIVLLDSDTPVPCCAVWGAIICWCGNEEEDDNEKKWEVLRKITSKRSGQS